MNKKSKIMLASALVFSSLVSASTTYSAYGATEAEARQLVLEWANGQDVGISCWPQSYGAPWKCTGTLETPPDHTNPPQDGPLVTASAYGHSKVSATASAIAAWRTKTSSSRTPLVHCEASNLYVGPNWRCTASGRA
ncbi:hypothetical protein [Pseudoalteromonas piscicida]|uniref:hypothetical protein n=1 Tax=Pseudoalteromonas piscicida TaxID=43662 RepID=UPI000E35A937|nr:hypothetical protein [Pseudoalteromonas piscicida]AXQ97233.1 hypothetical protein D0N37_05260 [Pseudoalteromonas piscicida]